MFNKVWLFIAKSEYLHVHTFLTNIVYGNSVEEGRIPISHR